METWTLRLLRLWHRLLLRADVLLLALHRWQGVGGVRSAGRMPCRLPVRRHVVLPLLASGCGRQGLGHQRWHVCVHWADLLRPLLHVSDRPGSQGLG